jgi:uncharacterized repeat protein (TIGR03803 family)
MFTLSSLPLRGGVRWPIFSATLIGYFVLSALNGAAQLTILHSFGDGTVPNDGARPQAGLIQASDGNFYGTTGDTALNPFGSGVIFQMTSAGAVSTLYTFTGLNLSPSRLLLYNGDLVGTTSIGGRGVDSYGTPGFGTIFKTSLSGQTVFLQEFSSDSNYPIGNLIPGPNGELYGTSGSADNQVGGTAFKYNPVTKKLTVLHSFPARSGPETPLLLGQDGNFYGSSRASHNTTSAIFMMTPAGNVTILYTFPLFTLGAGPMIQDAAGNFYGTTDLNGTYNSGTVFKMTSQYVVTILHSFGGSGDGFGPDNGVVIGPDGNLYGTTPQGGTKDAGVIYQLAPDGSTYTILHHFYDGSVANDGYQPNAPLIVGTDNNLYGTTRWGGSANLGVIFKIVP